MSDPRRSRHQGHLPGHHRRRARSTPSRRSTTAPIVGGVTPGKGGTHASRTAGLRHGGRGGRETGANASVIFVPPPSRPTRSSRRSTPASRWSSASPRASRARHGRASSARSRGSGSRLIGPNCPGVITPGECKIGIMPGYIHKPRQGRRGVALRHADLRGGGADDRGSASARSTCVGIGGDPVNGTTSSTASSCSTPIRTPRRS